MPLPIDDIKEQIKAPEFAREYGEELAKISMAVTIGNARKETGLTQEQLADLTGTSQPYIAKLEKGRANPSISTIAGILAVMGFRLVPEIEKLVPETQLTARNDTVCRRE